MKKWAIIIIVFLLGICLGYFIPHDDSCVWNLWDDPRGCVIAWDDGSYSYKSRIVEMGTIQPGESKEVMIGSSLYPNPEDLPRSNGMIHHPVYGSYPEKVYWRKRDPNEPEYITIEDADNFSIERCTFEIAEPNDFIEYEDWEFLIPDPNNGEFNAD